MIARDIVRSHHFVFGSAFMLALMSYAGSGCGSRREPSDDSSPSSTSDSSSSGSGDASSGTGGASSGTGGSSSGSGGSSTGTGGSSSSAGGSQSSSTGGPVPCEPETCPGADTPCKYRICTSDGCAFATPGGLANGVDTQNPCIEMHCDGQGNQVEVATGATPSDANACTNDVCNAAGQPEHTQLAPNAICKTGQSQVVERCTADGVCIECDDSNECTAEDCSTGAVVSTPEAIGTSCGGASGSECDGQGQCRGCKDPSTQQLFPEGTVCVKNAKFGTCDAVGTCVTWCQPLPDPATCPDNGQGEPGNGTQAGAFNFGSISDADSAGKLVCGVVQGADKDWYTYTGIDGFLSSVDRLFQAWSSDDSLRLCFYFVCTQGSAQFSCDPAKGEQPSTAPNGAPGCCVEKTFSLGSYNGPGSSFDCSGTNDDDANVWMSVELLSGGPCVPYALGFHY